MKSFIRFIIFNFLLLSLASCSFMIEDLKSSTKTSKYVVEHYLEVLPEYEKTDTGYVQSNLIIGEDGNLVPKFDLVESETFSGDINSLTQAKEKEYAGFYPQPFEQKTILSDNSSVVRIFYERCEVTITVDIGDGMWNYVQKKNDDSQDEDKTPRTFRKKFGASTADDFEGLFNNSGKKSCSLTKYRLSNGNEVEFLPAAFPKEDECYTAVWEEGMPANYKVVHHFEKPGITGEVEDSSENYEIDEELTDILKGLPETETATQDCIKTVAGFTAKPHSEKEIASNGTTVVDIYYSRNEVTLTINIGEGMWNYASKKADSSLEEDKTDRVVSGKYGSPTAEALSTLFNEAGKRGFALTKFILSDGTEIETLPVTFPAENETYTAVWEEGMPTNYKVVHHFEKLDCIDSNIESDENFEIIPEYTETKKGIPEMDTVTQDSAKDVPGFTPKPHSEKEIASNGSTVVDIFYVRNNYTVSISTDGGLWNYDEWKQDKANVEKDVSAKILEGKFGSSIDWSVLNTLKKTSMNLYGLKDEATEETFTRGNLPETIPFENTNYSAVWVRKSAVPYEVKFMTENLESTDSENEENYVCHSTDNTQTGVPEYLTEVTAKNIPGFTAKEITQQEIKEDGTTVVKVYYTRNSYKITFDVNGGAWNYSAYKADKENVVPDSVSREATGKFEENIVLPDFTQIGKKSSDLKGWKNLSDDKVYTPASLSESFEKFGSSNITLQAQWETSSSVEYTVNHWFEKTDSTDSSIESDENYELKTSLIEKKLGVPETETVTQDSAKEIAGFTVKPHSEKEIEGDGSTVIDIFYVRNSYKITFDLNGGYWNYEAYKADKANVVPDSLSKELTGKYEENLILPDFSDIGKRASDFDGWKNLSNNEVYTLVYLSENFVKFGSSNVTLQAQWKRSAGYEYEVKHWFERTDSMNSEDKTNYELNAELTQKQICEESGEDTEAVAKTVEGFTVKAFDQKPVAADGSTVVDIYYTRNEVTLTVEIGEGLWNYTQKKADPSVEEDKTARTITGKYGSSSKESLETLFVNSGKKSFTLTKFIVSDGTEIENLPETFPAVNKTYTAVWEEGKPTNYKVIHHFEKVNSVNSSIESDENYELKADSIETKQGVPEMETVTQDSVRTVAGFTAKPHSEKEIASNGSTVIDIFYVRNPYKITISTDDGLWNYDEWKQDKDHVTQNVFVKNIDGKYGIEIDWTVLNTLKKTGMNLSGLKDNSTGEVVTRRNLPETIPAKNSSYTAVWERKPAVSYEIKFMTEKPGSTDSEDSSNYAVHSSDNSKTGVPEYFTEAVAKEISGFTAKDVVQQEIKEDGTTVVYVYYSRNTYKITFDLNGGYWNYETYKADKVNVVPDSSLKELTGKYDENVVLPAFSDIGKRASNFKGWKNISDERIYTNGALSENFAKFSASNITLQAQWEKGVGYEYAVKHWFEKADSMNSEDKSNYVLNAELTQTQVGEESGEDTEAVAKTVEGFAAKAFAQKPVAADGSTVVDIYYTRNSSKFIFDANGGNITSGESEITGKYGAVFNSENTPVAQKANWQFAGWTCKGKLVTDSELKLVNQTFGIENITFQAYWKSVISVTAVTTFGDIVLTKVQDSQKITCSVTLPAGFENENWTYKWYVDGVYASDEIQFSRTPEVLGRGVHTITVKAAMNGQNFTQRVTATVD